MLVKKHILGVLQKLELEYEVALTSSDVNDPIIHCKLATLEYCGWIEETFDAIAHRAVKNKLKTQPYRDIARSEIQGTYGFSYKKHLRPMLSRIIGLVEMEKIETTLSLSSGFSRFLSELEQMKVHRDKAAHTWVKDTTSQFPSPSQIIGSLNAVYPQARRLYSEVIKLK